MKRLIFPLIFLVSLITFSQDSDEFMATIVGDKEAFLSSKTGEFIYRAHDDTDVSGLKTTANGVVYTETKIHLVKKGETLSAIAKKHAVTISDLKKANNMSKTNLSIGQELKVLKNFMLKSSSPVINQAEGKIIARLAPGQLPSGMTPDLPPDAMPGNTINLVTDDNVKPKAAQVIEEKVNNIAEDGSVTHVVKSGESLFTIAKKYRVSIKDLKATNNLALNTLSPGQKLKINIYNPEVFNQNQQASQVTEATALPQEVEVTKIIENSDDEEAEEINDAEAEEINEEAEADSNETETVEDPDEDSVEEDAVIEDDVEANNDINDLIVDEEEVDTNAGAEDVDTNVDEEAEKEVEAAEALEKAEIAAKKEDRINGLIEKYSKKETPATVTSSGVEKLPKKETSAETKEEKTHIVKKGESLWAISRQYKMSVTELIELNSLKSNYLSIGQKLIVK